MRRLFGSFDPEDAETAARLLLLLVLLFGAVVVMGGAVRVFRWLSGV